MDITPALISAAASAIWAVLLEWLPGLSDWFEKLDENRKKTTVGIILILTAFGSMLWNCSLGSIWLCLIETDWRTWMATVFATLVNQPVHRLTKKPDKKKASSRKSSRS